MLIIEPFDERLPTVHQPVLQLSWWAILVNSLLMMLFEGVFFLFFMLFFLHISSRFDVLSMLIVLHVPSSQHGRLPGRGSCFSAIPQRDHHLWDSIALGFLPQIAALSPRDLPQLPHDADSEMHLSNDHKPWQRPDPFEVLAPWLCYESRLSGSLSFLTLMTQFQVRLAE